VSPLRLGATCVCVAAVPVLAACGGGGGDPLQTVVKAARSTLAQGGAWNLSLADARPFGSGAPTIVGRGAFVPQLQIGYLGIEPWRAGHAAGGKSFLVFEPARVYLRPAAAALPAGRKWLAVTAATGKLPDRLARFVLQAEGLNPQLLLHEIAAGATAAVRRADVVVGHTPMSGYTVTIDLVRAERGSALTKAERIAVEAQQAALGSAKPVVQAMVAIDVMGRLARIEAKLPGSGYGTSSLHFTDFRVKLRRSLPPTDEVVDLAAAPATVAGSPWGG
jgi:hypothetical protein